jgi:hypothetical protein
LLGKNLEMTSSETKFSSSAETKTPIMMNGSASMMMLKNTALKLARLEPPNLMTKKAMSSKIKRSNQKLICFICGLTVFSTSYRIPGLYISFYYTIGSG